MRPEIQVGTELPEPRENWEPWAPQVLEEGLAQEDHRDNLVTKEMLVQPAGAESVEEQATRVTR